VTSLDKRGKEISWKRYVRKGEHKAERDKQVRSIVRKVRLELKNIKTARFASKEKEIIDEGGAERNYTQENGNS